jgi:hypothetical protein
MDEQIAARRGDTCRSPASPSTWQGASIVCTCSATDLELLQARINNMSLHARVGKVLLESLHPLQLITTGAVNIGPKDIQFMDNLESRCKEKSLCKRKRPASAKPESCI